MAYEKLSDEFIEEYLVLASDEEGLPSHEIRAKLDEWKGQRRIYYPTWFDFSTRLKELGATPRFYRVGGRIKYRGWRNVAWRQSHTR